MLEPEYTIDDFIAEETERDPQFGPALARAQRETDLQFALTTAREQRKMTQQALADRTGLTQPLIARIERGRSEPSLNTLKKLARGLEVQIIISPDEAVTVRSPSSLRSRLRPSNR